MKKFIKIAIALIVIPIIIVIIALTAFFKPLVEAGIHMAGFDKAVVEEATFGLGGSTLKNIRLDGKDNVISEVELFSSFADFRQGRVSEVYVKGGQLKWPLELPKSEATGPLNLRAVKIEFKGVTVTADTPAGPLPLSVEGAVVDSGGVYQTNATIGAETEFAKVGGAVVAVTGKNSRRTKLQYKLGETRIIAPDLEMRRVGGFVDAEIDPKKSLPVVNAQLAVGALKVFGLPMEETTLTIANNQKQTNIILKGEVINKSGSIYADVSIDNTDPAIDNMKMRVEAMLQNLSALEIAEMGGEGRFFVTATGAHEKDQPWTDMAKWKNLAGQAGIDMKDLTLPGLIARGEALATVALALDPATEKIALFATQGDVTFKGQLRALGNRQIYFNLPQNKAKPASLTWDHKEKSLKTSFVGGILSGYDFSGKWIGADLTAALSDAPALTGSLDIGELRHNLQPRDRFFIPVRLALKFTPEDGQKGVTKFSGQVTEGSGRLYAKMNGRHDFGNGKGGLDFDMPPTSFVSGVSEVANVFPFTGAYFSAATGTAGLTARLDWSKDAAGNTAVNSKGELYLKDMQMNVPGDTVLSGVSTVMKLESLSPVVIRQQNIAIGGVSVGLPLTGGLASVSLDAKRNLTVHNSSWTGAGGTITSTGFTLPLDTMSTKLILNAKGLDLQQLFQIAPLEGLSATGKVDGSLPIEVNGGQLSINNGSLQTTGTGVIRYNPQDMPAFLKDNSQKQIVDLKAALTQFQYESLGMTLNGALGQSQKVNLRIRGKNPLFYGGKPVNFNLNVEGPLENIIRYSPGSSRIPDSIRKQMEAYEKAHGR